MNKKQRFLSFLSGNYSEWMGYAFDGFDMPYPMVLDPITIMETKHESEIYTDPWGAIWRQKESDAGAVPLVTEENCVIKDLEHWQDYLILPDLDDLDFEPTRKQMESIDRDEQLVMFPAYYGPFERIHTLMPFEETLIAVYEEPEALSALMGAIVDWKMEAFGRVIDEFHPDIIHAHDDWGDASNLFFSPEIFRKVLKPHYTRMYQFIKSKGVLVQHHNDGIGRGLENDMIEMGIDMWQGVLPQNDIQTLKKNTKGKLLYMGGLDQFLLDGCHGDEQVIRAEVRRCIDEYAPGGAFLPCYPSVMPLDIPAMFIAVDEMNRYGEEWLSKNT